MKRPDTNKVLDYVKSLSDEPNGGRIGLDIAKHFEKEGFSKYQTMRELQYCLDHGYLRYGRGMVICFNRDPEI